MGKDTERPADSQSYIVPIPGRPRDLDRILADLRRSGLDIRHVFTDMPVWKVAGDLPAGRLGQLRRVEGIGEPQPEGSMTIEGPREGPDVPTPQSAPRPQAPQSAPRAPAQAPPAPPRSPRTGADLA